MAIAQPAFSSFEYAQDGTWTVSLNPSEDVTGWTVSTVVRAYNGGTALITKTIGSGITVSNTANGVFVTTFTAANLSTDLTYGPGAYVIQMHRTNAGYTYPITDPSPLVIRPSDSASYPTLTNLGEYLAHTRASVDSISNGDAQQLMQQLAAAEAIIQRLCNRKFVYGGSKTFYLNGNNTDKLSMPETPVQSVTSVYLDNGGYWGQASGAFASTTALTAGVDYALEYDDYQNPTWSQCGFIRRLGTVWPGMRYRPAGSLSSLLVPGQGNIKVVANVGFTLIPYPIKLAVWDATTLINRAALDGRIPTSQSGEGYSESFGSMTDEIKRAASVDAIVNLYRRPVMV